MTSLSSIGTKTIGAWTTDDISRYLQFLVNIVSLIPGTQTVTLRASLQIVAGVGDGDHPKAPSGAAKGRQGTASTALPHRGGPFPTSLALSPSSSISSTSPPGRMSASPTRSTVTNCSPNGSAYTRSTVTNSPLDRDSSGAGSSLDISDHCESAREGRSDDDAVSVDGFRELLCQAAVRRHGLVMGMIVIHGFSGAELQDAIVIHTRSPDVDP